MSACDRIRPELKAYCDGQLSALSRRNIRWHLAHCADCRREVEEMERISHQLHEEEESLTPALRARILASLPEGLPDAPDLSRRQRPSWKQPLWVVGGLATAALALAFFLPYRNTLNAPQTDAVAGSAMKSAAPAPSVPAAVGAPMASGASKNEADMDRSPIASNPSSPDQEQSKNPGAERFSAPGVAPGGAPAPPLASSGSFGGGKSRASRGDSFGGLQGASSGSAAGQPPAEPSRKVAAEAPVLASPPGAYRSPSAVEVPPSKMAHTRGIHYEATITLLVADAAAQSAELERIGKAVGGSSAPFGTEKAKAALGITLTIPATQFETVRKQIARLGEVQAEKINNKDLTDQLLAEEKAANRPQDTASKDAPAGSGGNSDHAGHGPAKPLTVMPKKADEAETRLRLLRQSIDQATITIHMVEKPGTTVPAAPGKEAPPAKP